MLCPTCSRPLNKIDVTTREGGRFQVDHCGFCGGTWFDPYEINRIPFHEVVNLASLSVTQNNKVQTEQAIHLCPNDHLPLVKFRGEAIPANVKLLSCKKCLGLWASQKDLLEFKKHQEEIVSAYDEGSKFFPSMSVVFVPALTFVFLLAITFSTITSLQDSREQRIFAESQITGLNINNAPDNSVIISFNTSNVVKSSLFYGLSALEMDEIVISPTASDIHNAVIPQLISGREYVYKIILTDQNGNSFTTDLKTFSAP